MGFNASDLRPKKPANSTPSGKDLIKAIKPLLSEQPIMNAKIDMPINDINTLTVKFIVTPELLKALADCKCLKP